MASFIETTKNTYLFGLLTLFVTIYGPRLSPKLPEPVQRAFSHPVFRGVIMFLVVFMAKHDIRTSIVVTVIFLILSHILHQENLTETFIQKYERNIENFIDANDIHGTVCATVEKNKIGGSQIKNPNKVYYDRQCYGKPGIDMLTVQQKCKSLEECDSEYCWKPVSQGDRVRYDLSHYRAPNDTDTSRSFQCTTPSDTSNNTSCKHVSPFDTAISICDYDKKNKSLTLSDDTTSDGINDLDKTRCIHNFQCDPVLYKDGGQGKGKYTTCYGSLGSNVKCVKDKDSHNTGKCINIPCGKDFNHYKTVLQQAGLQTVAKEADWKEYCKSPNPSNNLHNTILNPLEVSARFDTANFSEGEINDSSWPYLFINRQSPPKGSKLEDVPERAGAQNFLYQDQSNIGLGCWEQVYDLSTEQQIERDIAAPATDLMIYNPQSGDVRTGFGKMTDSVPASIAKFA